MYCFLVSTSFLGNHDRGCDNQSFVAERIAPRITECVFSLFEEQSQYSIQHVPDWS